MAKELSDAEMRKIVDDMKEGKPGAAVLAGTGKTKMTEDAFERAVYLDPGRRRRRTGLASEWRFRVQHSRRRSDRIAALVQSDRLLAFREGVVRRA